MLDKNKLLQILALKLEQLEFILDNLDSFYYCRSELKFDKTGKQLVDQFGNPRTRDLYPSIHQLEQVQERIHKRLLKKIKLPNYCFGGITGRDNIQNAKMHQGNKYFFTTDLRNFYPGISHRQVYKALQSKGFAPEVAHIITKLTTYKGMLPQGTHTSPFLANLVFTSAGLDIDAYCNERGFTFTSFVDDLTISAKMDFKPLTRDIIKMIKDKGFKISHNKTFYNTKPVVTGVIVQQNGLDLSETYKLQIEMLRLTYPESAAGKQNYLNRVKEIGKTKLSTVREKLKKK